MDNHSSTHRRVYFRRLMIMLAREGLTMLISEEWMMMATHYHIHSSRR
jgi:hypothetical protein